MRGQRRRRVNSSFIPTADACQRSRRMRMHLHSGRRCSQMNKCVSIAAECERMWTQLKRCVLRFAGEMKM